MPDWSVDPTQFEFSGTVTASVYIDEVSSGADGDMVAGFVDDELRGVAESMQTPTGDYVFMLLLYSNLEEGEQIHFNYYSLAEDAVLLVAETIIFADNMENGDPENPFILHALLEDCNGVPGGDAFIDECGYCVGGDTGLIPGFADVGCGCDIPASEFYCEDSDGDLLGNPGTDTEFCLPDLPNGWVTDCSDPEPDCISNDTDCSGTCGGSAQVDECDICCGGTTGEDCSYYNDDLDYGGAYDCSGTCFGDLEPDCLDICGGNSVCFPVIELFPTTITINDIMLGATGDGSAQLTNTGTSDLDISSISILPPFDQYINVDISQFMLSPTESATINVFVTPNAVGQFTAEVSILSNTDEFILPVEFNAIFPSIEVDEESLNFGDVLVGFASNMVFQITSSGLTPLEINSINFSHPQLFSSNLPANTTLNPDEVLPVTITFSPQNTGLINSSLIIMTNSDPVEILLTGQGVTPELSLGVQTLDFGAVMLLESGFLELTVNNIGNYELAILDETLNDANNQFMVESGLTVIPPQSSDIISIWFNPTLTGLQQATFTLYTTGGNASVALSGTAFTLPPEVINPLYDIVVDEDFEPFVLGNLSEVFADDFGPLSFSVDNDDPDLLTAVISDDDIIISSLENTNGIANLTVTAYDEGGSITESLQVSVMPIPDPVMTSNADYTIELNATLPITLTADDPDDDPLLFELLSGPDNGIINGDAPELEYTPDLNFFGVDMFTYRVFDGLFADTASVNITVNPAEFQLGFQVNMNFVEDLQLFLPEAGMQVFVHIFDGFFPGLFPLSDDDDDGIWTVELTQGIPDDFQYSFAIDPNGNGAQNTFVYELDGAAGARSLETLGMPDIHLLDVVNFDNFAGGPDFNEPIAASATGLFYMDDTAVQMFGSGLDQTAVSIGFESLDRNALVSVRRYNGSFEGDYPSEILVIGNNSYWWVNSSPALADFTATLSVHYNLLSGIETPADIQLLKTEAPNTDLEIQETEWQSWDQTILSSDLNEFSFWALGSLTNDNSLISQSPEAATNPTPLFDDINKIGRAHV